MEDKTPINIVRTSDKIFLNSKTMLIEYDDIIKSPSFTLLQILVEKCEETGFDKIFDFSELKGKSALELYVWYIKRKKKNILFNIPLHDGVLEEMFEGSNDKFIQWANEFIYEEYDKIDSLLENTNELNFPEVLDALLSAKMVDNIFIFTKTKLESVEKEISNRFNDKIKYVYGSIKEIIEEIKPDKDTTFVLSDLSLINELYENKVLKLSSVIISDLYGYNYEDDNSTPIVNYNEILKKSFFKIDFFDNITK